MARMSKENVDFYKKRIGHDDAIEILVRVGEILDTPYIEDDPWKILHRAQTAVNSQNRHGQLCAILRKMVN